MYGAVIGDLAGSIYEYDQLKKIKPIKMDKIIPDNAFYSDDTILTVAIGDAILNGGDYAILKSIVIIILILVLILKVLFLLIL